MGKWLRSLFTDVTKTAVLSLLAAIAPPAALVLSTGWDFVSTTHAVPGLVLLAGTAAAGLLVFSVVLNVMQWLRFRRASRRTLIVVADGEPSALWWHMGGMGGAPAMQICGDFHITNRSPYNVTVPRSMLLISYRVWRVIPWRRRVESGGIFSKTIKAHHLVRERLDWWAVPPVLKSGQVLHARPGLVDNFAQTNWGSWLKWEYR